MLLNPYLKFILELLKTCRCPNIRGSQNEALLTNSIIYLRLNQAMCWCMVLEGAYQADSVPSVWNVILLKRSLRWVISTRSKYVLQAENKTNIGSFGTPFELFRCVSISISANFTDRQTDRQTYRHLALFGLVKVFWSFELSCFDLYAPICSNWENWERGKIRKIGKFGKKGNFRQNGKIRKI